MRRIRLLTDIGLVLVLLAGINQTQQFTAGVVDPDVAMGVIAFVTAGLFAISIVQNRRNSLSPGQPLTHHYVTSLGTQLAVDVVGVVAMSCIFLVGVNEFVVTVPFRIYAFIGGLAVGVTAFIILFLLCAQYYKKTYADSAPPFEADV